jgi:hypothetical protein
MRRLGEFGLDLQPYRSSRARLAYSFSHISFTLLPTYNLTTMADSSFRRLDVDQYDEDRVLPSDLYIPDSRAPASVLSDTQGKATAVRGLLQRGDVRGALGEVLSEAPYGEGVDEAKVSCSRVV